MPRYSLESIKLAANDNQISLSRQAQNDALIVLKYTMEDVIKSINCLDVESHFKDNQCYGDKVCDEYLLKYPSPITPEGEDLEYDNLYIKIQFITRNARVKVESFHLQRF